MGACQNKDIYDPYDARPTASASASANGNAREQPKLATEAPLPVVSLFVFLSFHRIKHFKFEKSTN